MATFGVPWPNPRSLSVSFPRDNAAIGAFSNEIRQQLDQVTDRQQWQYESLRAFQTWAAVSNINVGLVPDRGDAFGTVGLTTDDPRFGEFRIGAFPQGDSLASAAPFDPLSGTWSGDVLLNGRINYFLGDWKSGNPIDIPDPNENGPAVELFSVLLHEAGNTLGLADNNVRGTVMNGTYSGPRGRLSAHDINAIRQLYGARRDIYEPTANNVLSSATTIPTPVGYDGRVPLSRMGSLNTSSDIDVYRFTPLQGKEKVSVRLWASGISLLKARLEVINRNGQVLADAKADSIFDNNLQLDIGSLSDHSLLFIRVSKNSGDVFAIGDYRIDLDYRPLELQPNLRPLPHDADADDDDDDAVVDYVSLDALFDEAGLLDSEVGQNDALVTSTVLETPPGFLPASRYEVTSALNGSSDRDIWRFRTPSFSSPTMTVTVNPLGADNPVMEVYVLNAAGDRLGARPTRKADGGLELIINAPAPQRDLYLFLRARADSAKTSGNYLATIDFATDPANQLTPLYTATVANDREHFSQLNVNKTQLMRFDLTTLAGSWLYATQLSIYNARTGAIEATIAARSGLSRSLTTWLSAGSYYLRASYRTRGNVAAQLVTFRLGVDVLSDDQGPRPSDPTQLPNPSPVPEYDWIPINLTTPPPIIDFEDPSLENPWQNDIYQDFVRDFYETLV